MGCLGSRVEGEYYFRDKVERSLERDEDGR